MNKEILQEEYLPKLHSEILSIMSFIDEFCTVNNIRYYLIGGSLLGAIRHQGFIPWDDDLDIVMPREDFNRFIELCNTSLPNPYKYVWLTNKKDYWLPFAKVYKADTLFQEKECESKNFGIYVDIFPLDETAGYSKAVEFRKKLIQKLFVIKHIKNGFQEAGALKRMIANLVSHSTLNKIYFYLSTMTNNSGEYYTNFGSQYNAKKQTIAKKSYGTGARHIFESEEYNVPSQCVEVLTSIFGAKYMELPPEDKRRTHYPIKVVFSDGTYIVNEISEKRVAAE